MNFRFNDPGAVQYGNFINYYQFNSAEDRIQLLPKEINLWKPGNLDDKQTYTVLDIGCNSGSVTQLIYKFFKNEFQLKIKILAIDIDPTLIQRAKESNIFPDDITYRCLDIMDLKTINCIEQFLHSFGKSKFDVVFCFSITMWIHLNHEDEGLKTFLQNCTNLTELLVIEPQPWKCYQNAIHRMRKAKDIFPHFRTLKWRSNIEQEIENYLENELNQIKIHESSPTKWKRKICLYRHK